MLKWIEQAVLGAVKLTDKFDAFNTLRQLAALDKRVTDMPEVRDWCWEHSADVVRGLYSAKDAADGKDVSEVLKRK